MARQKTAGDPRMPNGKHQPLPKVATRIAGLDEVLRGGFPAGRTSLVSGGPGSGKSILGLEFLYRGAVAGEPGIFVAFEERAEAVRQNALTLGWDLAPLEKTNTLFLLDAHVSPEAILSGDFNLQALLAIVEGKARAMKARRIVFDALGVLLRLFADPVRERNELHALHDWLTDHQMTALLTAKASTDRDGSARFEFLDYMADCVLHLDQRVDEQITTRRARVIKYRGSDFTHNEYPFVITRDGINIIPISTVRLQHRPFGPKVSSGHARLDTITDGGYLRGACILFVGTSGTGKTTLAATFVQAACQRGEKVLFVSFEESEEAIVSGMLSPGIDLRPALRTGTLRILTAMPEAMGAEEHLLCILQAIEALGPDHVIVDAISSSRRMGSEQTACEYVVRLVNACKGQGRTIILTNQTAGFQEEHEISGMGISSLVDTVIFLRYIDVGGEVNRMLLVMKSRGSKHSNQYREFLISDQGIDLADVYVGEGGVLTGIARQEQEAKETAQRLLRQQEIERKQREIAHLRAAMDVQTAKLQLELAAAETALEELKLARDVSQAECTERARLRGEDRETARFQSLSTPAHQGGAVRKRAAE